MPFVYLHSLVRCMLCLAPSSGANRCTNPPESDAVLTACDNAGAGEKMEGMEEGFSKCETLAVSWAKDPKSVRLSLLIEQLRGFLGFWPLDRGHWRVCCR